MARLQTVTVLSAKWQELVERKLTKAISIYSWQKTKLTKKRGGSLTIFAVLTARTLYTYKYEVAINNDTVHCSMVFFYPWNHRLEMSPSVGSAGHLSGLHLSGFPLGRPTCPAGRRTPCPRRVSLSCRGGGHPAVWVAHRWRAWLGAAGFFSDPNFVFHFIFRSS